MFFPASLILKLYKLTKVAEMALSMMNIFLISHENGIFVLWVIGCYR